jgi:hypothetical protein
MPLRVASRLSDYTPVDVSPLFTERGTPTLVEFGVDWDDEDAGFATERITDSLGESIEAVLAGGFPGRGLDDVTHVHHRDIPPSMIFSIEHPKFEL